MLKRYRISLLLFFLISTIIYIIEYVYINTNIEVSLSHFYLLNIFSVLIFFIIFISVIKISGFVSIHSFIHFFYMLFIYGRSILYIFEPDNDIFEAETLTYDYLGVKNLSIALIITTLFIICINYCYFFLGKSENFSRKPNNLNKSEIVLKITYKFLIFTSIIFFIKLLIEFFYINKVGYLAVYNGGIKDINYYSFVIQYSHVIFYSLFSFFISIYPPKREFKIISIIYIFLSIIDSLKGARVTLILPIFLIIWYNFKLFNKKINFNYLFKGSFLFFLIILYSLFLSNQRNDSSQDLRNNFIKSSLLETGSTLQFIARYVKYKETFKTNSPFFLEPIFYPYYYATNYEIITSGQSENMLKIRNSLNHQLTAKVDLDGYVAGNGLGSSTPAEFYQYGIIPLVFISVIFGWFLIWVYSQISNPFFLFISSSFLLQLFFLSRDTPFINLIGIIKSTFVYIIFNLIFNYISNKSKKLNYV